MAKIRIDSFAAKLTEEQSWQLFHKSRICRWEDAAAWAVKEFGLERMPSRTAFFEWRNRMQKEEHAHNLSQALIAQAHARDLAKDYRITDDTAIKALMSTAVEATLLTHDAKLANSLISNALAIRDRALKDRDITLQEKKFAAAEARLKAVNAEIQKAKDGGGLTPETLKKIEEAANLL